MKTRSITWDLILARPTAQTARQAAQPAALRMDDESFAGFYQRTARPLWAYLARVSGSPTLADDLVQECYLRFLNANIRAEGEVAYRCYLFRIGTNLLRDHWRRPRTTSLEDVPQADFDPGSMRDSERAEAHSMLAPALSRLQPRERQLLWLAYAEGATHNEIAEIVGIRSASVRLLLFRARRKLARMLTPGKSS